MSQLYISKSRKITHKVTHKKQHFCLVSPLKVK